MSVMYGWCEVSEERAKEICERNTAIGNAEREFAEQERLWKIKSERDEAERALKCRVAALEKKVNDLTDKLAGQEREK